MGAYEQTRWGATEAETSKGPAVKSANFLPAERKKQEAIQDENKNTSTLQIRNLQKDLCIYTSFRRGIKKEMS